MLTNMLFRIEDRLSDSPLVERVWRAVLTSEEIPPPSPARLSVSMKATRAFKEGAIYIIGWEKGLKAWRDLLRNSGYLVVTHISWLTPDIPSEARHFWEEDYPEITTIKRNVSVIQQIILFCRSLLGGMTTTRRLKNG
jgi:hypothetical protein